MRKREDGVPRTLTVITDDELLALRGLIDELSLDRAHVMAAHQRYVRDLVWYAFEDGVITERENRDLLLVSGLLGVSQADLDGMIAEMSAGEVPEDLLTHEHAYQGKSVCFTGALTCAAQGMRLTGSMAEDLARAAGMVPASRVTRDLDYLVVADPNTQSSKAKKARAYDIPILAETAFWLKLGVEVH